MVDRHAFRSCNLGALLAACGLLFASASIFPTPAEAQKFVSALGFVEPEGGIYRVSGAVANDGAAVAALRVSEGDRVEAGEIVAILQNHDRLRAALQRSQARVLVEKARLDLARAGASEGAIKAREAVVDRLTVQAKNAANECERATVLRQRNTLSQAVRDQRCLEEQVFTRQLAEAKAQLADIVEIRPVDIAVYRAVLHDAEAEVEQAHAEYERSLVRAPISGRVLKIHAKAGEAIGPRGIIDLGRTDRMWVRAEVYETDIERVRVGQSATITSNGFEGELLGTVAETGLIIGKNEIVDADPAADVDARVVEVKIQLSEDASKAVEDLTNLQVRVQIAIAGDA